MESGAAAAHGGGLLLLMKLSSVNISKKPLKSPNLCSHYSFRRLYTSTIPRNSHWESNAETFKSQKFKFKFRDKNRRYKDNDDIEGGGKGKKRRWWTDELEIEEEKAPSLWEEVFDSLWILKVFKSYGWVLPPIIISLLIANGPKAFLMALALPLGQSILSFLFQKLWGRTLSKPRRKAGKRRKPFVSYPSDAQMNPKEEEEEEEMLEPAKANQRVQSWVVDDNSSVKKDNQKAPSFGGWDELNEMGSAGYSPRRAGQYRRKPVTNGKLGESRRESDAPLLLRLLIAAFPFLSSWIEIFGDF